MLLVLQACTVYGNRLPSGRLYACLASCHESYHERLTLSPCGRSIEAMEVLTELHGAHELDVARLASGPPQRARAQALRLALGAAHQRRRHL